MHRVNRVLGHLAPKDKELAAEPSASLYQVLGDISPIPLGSVLNSERHGGDLVAEVLKAHGVKFVFTLVGGHISPILVSAKRSGIRIIDVRHEVTTVFAADAVARLTGVPGVAAVTAGPGVTNTITALKNAQMAQSPLVLLGGAAATLLKGRGSLQDIEQMAVVRSIVKWSACCTRLRDVVPMMRRAFQEAASGVPGPVFVEFPVDMLHPILEVKAGMNLARKMRTKQITPALEKFVIVPEEYKGKTAADFLKGRGPEAPVYLENDPKDPPKQPAIVDAYMKFQLSQIFAGAFDYKLDYSPLPVYVPQPKSSELNRALAYLKGAKRPVFVLNSQSMLRPAEAQNLADAISALGVPTFLGGMARGLLGRNNKYHIRQNRGQALKNADVVILAGCVCDFRMDYGRALSAKSTIISVNRSAAELAQNAPIFWKPTMTSQSDPCTFMLQLLKLAGPGNGKWDDWANKLKTGEVKKEEGNAAKRGELAVGHHKLAGNKLINPIDLFYRLEEQLPDNAILVADGGDFVATCSYIIRPRGPLTWLDPGAFGTLGVGGGFALGAKLCRPEAEVWLIWGDGSAGYSIAEYDTYMRHNAPVIALIGNDACWAQIERDQTPTFGDDVACPLEYTAYNTVAIGYGAAGIQVTQDGEVDEAIKTAQTLAKQGTAVVVNALIGKSDFREGSLSF